MLFMPFHSVHHPGRLKLVHTCARSHWPSRISNGRDTKTEKSPCHETILGSLGEENNKDVITFPMDVCTFSIH